MLLFRYASISLPRTTSRQSPERQAVEGVGPATTVMSATSARENKWQTSESALCGPGGAASGVPLGGATRYLAVVAKDTNLTSHDSMWPDTFTPNPCVPESATAAPSRYSTTVSHDAFAVEQPTAKTNPIATTSPRAIVECRERLIGRWRLNDRDRQGLLRERLL